jgi:hypothetical protein
MNSISLSEWRTCFAAVLFETDQKRFKSRIAEASRAIDERLHSAAEVGSIERISIETAQRSLAAMEREPFAAPRRKLQQVVTADEKSGSGIGVTPNQHGIGSRVRFTLPSGEAATAEIVVIFTASAGKNILVSLGNQFLRIGPEQILDCMSAKA